MKNSYLICALFIFTSFFAQNKEKLSPIAVYEQAWSERNSEARLKLIKTIWLEDSTFEDPSASIKGINALNKLINEFYKKFPEAILTSGPKVIKDNYVSWDWKIMDAQDKLIVSGRDFVRLNGKGQISKVIGFWDTEVPSSEADILKVRETENLNIVAKYYELLFKKQDMTALATLIEAGAVYNQAEELPFGGVFVGFAEWTKMYAKSVEYFDLQIEKEPVYFTAATQNEVIMYFTIKCKSKKSGKTLSMPLSEHFDLKNGKITGVRPFFYDTKLFADFLKSKK